MKNCEECGWPLDVCCCEPITHPDNPVGVRRCGECGGDHEPSGARTDCIIHWKRRAIVSENKVLVAKVYGHPMLNWLLSNLHLIRVHVDAAYCDKQNKPSANFRFLDYDRGGRQWSEGEQLERLKTAIELEMAKEAYHETTDDPNSPLNKAYPIHASHESSKNVPG